MTKTGDWQPTGNRIQNWASLIRNSCCFNPVAGWPVSMNTFPVASQVNQAMEQMFANRFHGHAIDR